MKNDNSGLPINNNNAEDVTFKLDKARGRKTLETSVTPN